MAQPPLTIAVDMRGVLLKNPEKADDIYTEEMSKSMREGVSKMEKDVKARTPVGAVGALRGSVFSEIRGRGLNLHGIVSSPSAYAEAVEVGQEPHFPPPEPLEAWVKGVFGLTNKRQIRRVAYAIGRAISRFGVEGRFMFRNAFQANKERVIRLLEDARDRIVRRLGGS